jgi:glycosyltransferase involved in cell wall biosynthesis
MKISVVIPAFNEEKLLPATLAAVNQARQAFAPLGWESEVVVCDNNSTDQTAAVARAAGARVAFEPHNQIARARNTGAAAATGDWLVFVDADSRPSPGLFGSLAEAIRGGKCLAGGSTVEFETDVAWARRATTLWNAISRVFNYAAGSFIFCETATFRALGGFSHELYVSEEIELSQRLKKEARRQGRRMVILTGHPLLTSGRKMKLYTFRDHLRFLGRFLLRGRRQREHCFLWYDGRR